MSPSPGRRIVTASTRNGPVFQVTARRAERLRFRRSARRDPSLARSSRHVLTERGGARPAFGGECRNGAVVQRALLVPAPCQPFFLFVLSGLFANRDSPHCAAYLTEILPPVPGDGV